MQAVRTVDSGHCRLCCRCVYRRDHHCLYLNRCVAADTQRLFFAFLLVAITFIASFEYICMVYLRRRHAGPLWRVMAEVFDTEVAVWPICILDALAACFLTAVVIHQLLKISGESLSRQQSKLTVNHRLRSVVDFAVGRDIHADDQRLADRGGHGDCAVTAV